MRSPWHILTLIVRTSASVAGTSVLAMIAITCADVILRRFGMTLHGAYDLARIFGGVAIAGALPLTTAVKGHVAIEYFFHKLGSRGRLVVDSLMRALQFTAFCFAAFAFFRRGLRLYCSGELMPTLSCPVFLIAWLIAVMSLLTAAVSLFHLLRPGRELMRQ